MWTAILKELIGEHDTLIDSCKSKKIPRIAIVASIVNLPKVEVTLYFPTFTVAHLALHLSKLWAPSWEGFTLPRWRLSSTLESYPSIGGSSLLLWRSWTDRSRNSAAGRRCLCEQSMLNWCPWGQTALAGWALPLCYVCRKWTLRHGAGTNPHGQIHRSSGKVEQVGWVFAFKEVEL